MKDNTVMVRSDGHDLSHTYNILEGKGANLVMALVVGNRLLGKVLDRENLTLVTGEINHFFASSKMNKGKCRLVN